MPIPRRLPTRRLPTRRLPTRRWAAAALLLAGAFAVPALPAAAQAPRNGSVANGRNYQPTQNGVAAAQHDAGVAPSAQQEDRNKNDVEQLNQQLQNAENNDPLVHPNGQGKVDPNH